jgi:aryl-alcohol dehydrogenase-like predicted oxidoreductase
VACIDILYVHFWDYTTAVAEVMNALDTLVRQRKVLYLGISDTPGESASAALGSELLLSISSLCHRSMSSFGAS